MARQTKTQVEQRKEKREARKTQPAAEQEGTSTRLRLEPNERAYFDNIQRTQGAAAADAYRKQVFADRGASQRQAEADRNQIVVGGVGGAADTIRAQAQANRESQVASTVNTQGPLGNVNTTFDPVTGQPTQTVTMSPQEQQILAAEQQRQMEISGASQNALNTYNAAPAFTLDGLPQVDVGNEESRLRVEDALMRRQQRLIGDSFSQQRALEEANLRQRGFQFGGTDYNRQFNERVTTPQQQARLDMTDRAILGGRDEAVAAQGMQMNARNQGIQERVLRRSQPLSEMQQLNGMQRSALMPNASPVAQRGPTDVMGATNMFGNWANAQTDRNWQTQQAALDRRSREGIAAKGGGGVPGYDIFALENTRARNNQDAMILEAKLRAQNQPQMPRQPGAFESIASGLAAGAGNYLGSQIF